MAREVFRKFKACVNVSGVYDHRGTYDAINIVSKSLQEDRDQADISQIIQELHGIIGESIIVGDMESSGNGENGRLYDISAIDFERLRQEFAKIPHKNTKVQNLKEAIEKRLILMLAQNPLRTDFQQHYENLITEYNREQDRPTIERTFEALLKFVGALDEEQERAVREGLDEPTLALFDLLKKDELTPDEIKHIKTVAVDLYAKVQAELTHLIDWQWKEATRDRMKQTIFDFLYSDETGAANLIFRRGHHGEVDHGVWTCFEPGTIRNGVGCSVKSHVPYGCKRQSPIRAASSHVPIPPARAGVDLKNHGRQLTGTGFPSTSGDSPASLGIRSRRLCY